MILDSNVTIAGTLQALDFMRESGDSLVASAGVYDITPISQAAYDALGPGRNSSTLYIITS